MTNPFAMFTKANLATVDALVRKVESTTNPHQLDLWFMALATAGDAPGVAGAMAQREFMRLHNRVPVYGVSVHDVVKISKAEVERRQTAERAYELGVLQREHPSLYAELQVAVPTSKADVVTLGRQAALRRLEELTTEYLVTHQPKPTVAKPGEKPVPVGPVMTRAQAYVKVLETGEGRRLYELTR